MKTVRLTMAQALVRFLENQYIEVDGEQSRFVRGVFIIPGHGNVVGLGQALSQEAKHLEVYQGKNEQGMAQAAVAFAKQMKRKQICVATSSVGPGAANMVTACGTATANNIPLLVLPGDVYACRQPDPVLQQVEQTNNLSISTNDAFKAVCRYWDRVVRPEQLMSAMINAFRVLTDPANTGAVCVAMPQDVEGEAYDYPVSFFAKRVWRLERRPATEAALADAAEAIRKAKRPMMICGGGVRYSEAHAEFLHFAETFGIPYEAHILSAHRTPAAAADFARSARANGFGVLICAAGMAAHLAGAFAGNSTLPVIGIPMKGGAADGLDALLATVQMPSGIPVATVAINGAKNAAVLAAQILSVSDDALAAKLDAQRSEMAEQIAAKEAKLQAELAH